MPPGPVTEESGNARKRFSRTLSGDEPVAPVAELDDEGQSVAERNKPQGNTLLGHPPTPAAGSTVPGQPGPVLAPPKWRGASAYREGDEPQPHVSLIPVPPPLAAADAAATGKSVGVPIGVMRSTVKTKVGQPPSAGGAPAAFPKAAPSPPLPRTTRSRTPSSRCSSSRRRFRSRSTRASRSWRSTSSSTRRPLTGVPRPKRIRSGRRPRWPGSAEPAAARFAIGGAALLTGTSPLRCAVGGR